MAMRAAVGVFVGIVVATAGALVHGQERAAGAGRGDELLERTLAIVGGAVVTQADVTLALALGLVEAAEAMSPATALAALVDRWLVLHEIARFAPAEPDAAAVDARLAALRARVGDDTAARAVAASGRGPSFLAAWVRDDLRIASYLESRFASAGAPAESEVAVYVQARAAEFTRAGVSGAEAAAIARARLVEERRRELIADWLADLRRRTSVVTFPAAP